jgi:riboflavin biosynthesis pyrimidine reductase
MRQLYPAPENPDDTVDLDASYWIDDPGRQVVTGMMVSTADGAAQLDGRSGGLGNAADSALFALLRAQADVLLVGAGTARAEGYAGDHPVPAMRALRARRGLTTAPRMALVTNRAALEPTDPLFTDTEVRPLVVTSAAAPRARVDALAGVADVVIAGDARVDLGRALDELADRGLRRVSCEGGPTLLAQVVAADRLDELRLTLSPLLTAGDAHRITAGPVVHPRRMELVHLLEDDDHLFLRYRLARTAR